jgi:capsular exopolysaccharide synthesis family protein
MSKSPEPAFNNLQGKMEENGHSSSFLKSDYELGRLSHSPGFNNNNNNNIIISLITRRKNQLIGASFVFFIVVVGLTLFQRIVRPKYESSFQLLVSDPTQDDSGRSTSGSNSASQFLGLSNTIDVATLISVLKSRVILLPVVNNFSKSLPAGSKDRRDFDLTWKNFIDGKANKLPLTILQERGPRYQDVNVLQMSYESYDPYIAKSFLNKLSDAYIKYSIEQKKMKVEKGIAFLNQEYPLLSEKLAKIEYQVELFRKKYNLVEPLEQSRILVSQINNTRNVLDTITTQLSSKQDILNELIKKNNINFASKIDNALSTSQRYQSLLDHLLNVNKKIAEMKAKYTAENNILIDLYEEKSSVQSLLSQEAQKIIGRKLTLYEIQNLGSQSTTDQGIYSQFHSVYLEYLTLRSEQKAQQELLLKFKKEFEVLPEINRRYSSILREYEVANKNLMAFIDAREKLRLDLAQRITSWEVVAEPVLNTEPMSPNLGINFAFAILGGLCFGVIYAYAYDKYDNVFHSAKEVNGLFDTPILGQIPYNKSLEGIRNQLKLSTSVLEILDSNNSKFNKNHSREALFFHECFNTLYSNLEFLNTDTKIKSICITSTIPGEGKSIVSIFLAKKMSEFGKKVLIIDADLRRPQIHLRLQLPNLRGLSNLIVNDLSFKEVIQPITDDLFVLTSGQIPPEPSRLLGSKRMTALMEELREHFDYIIYDTPPLLGITDTYFIAPHIDSFLWVVSLGKVRLPMAIETFNAIKFRELNLGGCVVNSHSVSYSQSSALSYYSYYVESSPGHKMNFYEQFKTLLNRKSVEEKIKK